MSESRDREFERFLMLVWEKTQTNLSLSNQISTCDELRDYLLSPDNSDVYNAFYLTFQYVCKNHHHQGFGIDSFTSFLNCETIGDSREIKKSLGIGRSSVEYVSSLDFLGDEASCLYQRHHKEARCRKKFERKLESQRAKGMRS